MVLICTPAYGHRVHIQYMIALLAELREEHPDGIGYLHTCSSDIVRARNKLAATALSVPECTHTLWIDADESWDAGLVNRLLSHDKDIVSAAYMKKKAAHEWVYAPLPGDVNVEGDLIEVDAVGFGAVLVKRCVFEKMAQLTDIQVNPSKLEVSEESVRQHYASYFHPMIHNGEIKGEDYSFCVRARQLGFQVWVDLEPKINHFGDAAFYGDPREALVALQED